MHRRLSVLWIPLLTALLAGPLVERTPGDVWSGKAMLQAVDSLSSAVQYALPTARPEPALNPRSPIDRGAGALWSALPARPASRIFSTQLLPALARRDRSPLAGSARQFPLFPTGPPSHS